MKINYLQLDWLLEEQKQTAAKLGAIHNALLLDDALNMAELALFKMQGRALETYKEVLDERIRLIKAEF
jgi:hypothetical protein